MLQGFSSKWLVGGASNTLRQEFRELELLDEITALRFADKLPNNIGDGDTRIDLIDAY